MKFSLEFNKNKNYKAFKEAGKYVLSLGKINQN